MFSFVKCEACFQKMSIRNIDVERDSVFINDLIFFSSQKIFILDQGKSKSWHRIMKISQNLLKPIFHNMQSILTFKGKRRFVSLFDLSKWFMLIWIMFLKFLYYYFPFFLNIFVKFCFET